VKADLENTIIVSLLEAGSISPASTKIPQCFRGIFLCRKAEVSARFRFPNRDDRRWFAGGGSTPQMVSRFSFRTAGSGARFTC
jgi:hypothetical protein